MEAAVGREVRRAGLRYQDYLDLMENVRTIARKDKLDPWKAARCYWKSSKMIIRAIKPSTRARTAVRRSPPKIIGIGPIRTTPPADIRSDRPLPSCGPG